jgi:hypothetical protein
MTILRGSSFVLSAAICVFLSPSAYEKRPLCGIVRNEKGIIRQCYYNFVVCILSFPYRQATARRPPVA